MIYINAVVYGPTGPVQFMHGPEDQIVLTLAMPEWADFETRILPLELADVCLMVDERLPRTAEEFDAKYGASPAP